MNASRLLIVERDTAYAAFMSDAFRHSLFEACECTDSFSFAQVKAAEDRYGMILVDISQLGYSSDVLRQIRDFSMYAPVFVACNNQTEKLARRAVISGACGYVNKQELSKEQLKELVEQAYLSSRGVYSDGTVVKDRLTGFYSKDTLNTFVDRFIKRADPSEFGLFVIRLKVDSWSRIVNEYGHSTGDMAMVEVGGVLKDVLRGSDMIARPGADEFVVVAIDEHEAADSRSNNGERIVERLTNRVNEWNRLTKRRYDLSFSTNISYTSMNHAFAPELLS